MQMFKVKSTLTVAMAEPQSLPAIDRLRQLTGCKIRPVLALEHNIREYVRKYAGGNVDVDAFLASLSTDSDVQVVERETIDEGPATDLDKMVAALEGLGPVVDACAKGVDPELATKGAAFFAAVDTDARVALAALELVLAREDISSQLIDNLNANIHLRALLTDLFLVDDLIDGR